MNDLQMVLLTVFFLCFLCAAGKNIVPDDVLKETGYLKAFEIISRANDWSEEEDLPVGRPVIYNDQLGAYGYQNYTWAMGLRGKDHYGRRYFADMGPSGCMASLVAPTMALTPCECVYSWYLSYLKNPMNTSMFRPHPDRTINDITAPYLFVHHTLHTGSSYFVGEDVRYYGIVNRPVKSSHCTEDVADFLREVALVLLEVETPVVIDNVPAVIPSNIITESPDEIAESSNLTALWTLRLLTYGTRLRLKNQIIYPNGRKLVPGQRLNLRDELVSVRLKQARGADKPAAGGGCDTRHDGFSRAGIECWKSYSSLPLCHVMAGSPIVTNDGISIYGITMNEILCDEEEHALIRPSELGYLQVRRLGGEFEMSADGEKGNRASLVEELLVLFKDESERRDKIKEALAKPQELFLNSPGKVNYDEDFFPNLIERLRKRVRPKSHGVRISGLVGIVVSFIRLIFL